MARSSPYDSFIRDTSPWPPKNGRRKAIIEAREQLERLQSHPTSTDEEPEKRGPGRPPKAPVSLEQAEQALEATTQEHERLAQQRANKVQQSIRGIG